MAWSCDVPLWLWLDSALDEAVAMSYTTMGTYKNHTHTHKQSKHQADDTYSQLIHNKKQVDCVGFQ